MSEQTFDERAKEAWAAALAFELVSRGAEGRAGFLCSPALARCLHRLIGEPDYRAIAMDLWHELFVRQNAELLEQMKAELTGDDHWYIQHPAGASLTDGTPPPSKS
jgi:hypothetical protein